MKTTQTLIETLDTVSAQRIDRSRGILHGVKILGSVSKNGRSYPDATLNAAIPLYEGAKVNLNHPDGHPNKPRSYQDRFGIIRNVMLKEGDGLYADFHFNPHHPLAEQFLWDAENAPENVGFSHNVEAVIQRSGKQCVVEAITAVRSVDLVADPATTCGLFEAVNEQEAGLTQSRSLNVKTGFIESGSRDVAPICKERTVLAETMNAKTFAELLKK